jgi:hypothetical protein
LTPRPAGWADRLAALIRERRRAPFVWGQHDCCLWAADAVLAIRGFDLAADYRGTYSTAAGALRALRARGHRLPVDAADAALGERRIAAMAKIGDVVAWTPPGEGGRMGPALGVCYGARSLFVGTSAGQAGLVTLDTSLVEHSYLG